MNFQKEQGVRILLTREGDGPSCRYRGFVAIGDVEQELEFVVEEAGAIREVRGIASAPSVERALLVLKSVLRHAEKEGLPLPRRINRWRETPAASE